MATGGTFTEHERVYRSLLYVPAHKPGWLPRAIASGADGLILDLEDAVPPAEKAAAREGAAASIEQVRAAGLGVFVRVNGWGDGLTADVAALVPARPTGLVLPKVAGARHIVALDVLLGDLEAAHGVEPGTIEIVPLWETAYALMTIYESCASSPRVRRCTGGPTFAPGTDRARALGIEPTVEALETLYASSKAVLEARAAGLLQVFGGTSADVTDLDVLRTMVRWAKRLGCVGTIVIHPTHVPIVNDAFSVTEADVVGARATLEAMAAAIARGDAATRVDGIMVDLANARVAEETLAAAAAQGLDTGPQR